MVLRVTQAARDLMKNSTLRCNQDKFRLAKREAQDAIERLRYFVDQAAHPVEFISAYGSLNESPCAARVHTCTCKELQVKAVTLFQMNP